MEAATATQTEAPADGRNEPLLDDDAVVAVNLSKIRAAADAAASGHASYRSVLGHAEAKGLHLKAAKRALAIVKTGTDAVDAWIEENAAVTRYLRILRHGVTSNQLELFQTESHLAPIDEVAGLDGLSAGRLGQGESENPHDLSTAAGQAWLEKFRQGSAEREAVLAMAPPEAGPELIEGEAPPSDETSFEDDAE